MLAPLGALPGGQRRQGGLAAGQKNGDEYQQRAHKEILGDLGGWQIWLGSRQRVAARTRQAHRACRPSRPLKNVGEAAKTRQKWPKKQSLRVVNEHFEAIFNAILATQVVFQRPASARRSVDDPVADGAAPGSSTDR